MQSYINFVFVFALWFTPYESLLELYLFQAGCLCNNAKINSGVLMGQPTEGALLVAAMKVRVLLLTGKYFDTIITLDFD